MPPLKFGEKAKSIKTFNHRLESMAMAKERKKEARKLDMRLWESNKAKAVAK